jgi:hypothetical protein
MRLPAELEGTHEERETQAQKQAPDATLEEKTGETSSGEPFADGLDEEQAGGPVPAAEAGFDEDENTVLVIDDERARSDRASPSCAKRTCARSTRTCQWSW